jgi:hypothetical protein
MTQPTHDEVIAWIDKEIAIQRQYLDSSFYLDKKPPQIQLSVWLAIRDVLELHKPQEITLPNGDWGANCTECDGWEYPCPTIQAIEKELT